MAPVFRMLHMLLAQVIQMSHRSIARTEQYIAASIELATDVHLRKRGPLHKPGD